VRRTKILSFFSSLGRIDVLLEAEEEEEEDVLDVFLETNF
jgi:hypothetical protein